MKVLVAEDDTALRLILKKLLAKWGYGVVVAEDGNQAWQLLQTEKPDLAVLDWMMPGADGVELCRKIREKQDMVYVYVIMLTSKSENENIIDGLDAGADDYIVKPFDEEVLRSRVAVGVRIVQYETLLAEKNAQLQQYSSEMEKLADDRFKQLVHAERMTTIGLLSAGIAHEICNPTAFIAGNVQMLKRFCGDMEPVLREQILAGGENIQKLEFILEETPKIIEDIHSGATRISRIVKGLKGFCRKNENLKVACDINTCVEQALELCHNNLKYHVTVEQDLAEVLPQIEADSQQIEQVLVNLFVNAADAMKEKPNGETERETLSIKTQSTENAVIVTVGDTGSGIPEDKLNDIWQPFFTTKPVDKGTGLGLFTVHGIIENHGGQIKVENKPTGGALFTIVLPVQSQGDKQ